MDDEEAEMARLRQTKRHQAFEHTYHRADARRNKQQLQAQLDRPSSPSPPPTKSKHEKSSSPATTSTKPQEEDGPMLITDAEIQQLPTAFGKQKPNSKQLSASHTASQQSATKPDLSDPTLVSEASQYMEHVMSKYKIPIKYVAKLKGHSKLISSMSLDRSGTRLLTGSYDHTVKLWDFGGMNCKLESFRSVTPFEGYPVHSVAYNHTGSLFLCCTGSHKAKIYDRDARQLCEFRQGDMYIRDMNHTFGHTMPLTGGKWFGADANRRNVTEVATWSQDSTFRIWDIERDAAASSSGNSELNSCKQIIKARNKRGKRVSISAADFGAHNDFGSLLIVVGCNDGSLQLFDHKSHCKRPKTIIEKAHVDGCDVSCVLLDGNMLLSRGGKDDATLKVWDLRMLAERKPLKVFEQMHNVTSLANVIAPVMKGVDDKVWMTPCSNLLYQKKGTIGKSMVCVIDKLTLGEMARVPMSTKPINHVIWHPKINQLFVAGNDSCVKVFYEDAPISKNGVLLCAERKYKKKHIDEQMTYLKIVNPNALRVYRRQSQIQAEKRKKDLRMHKPELPHYGIGVGGRINSESFTHHVYKSQAKNVMSQVDPRDRLLMFNDKAVQNQEFTAIYNVNQPQPVFQEKNEEELEASSVVSKLYSDMPGARQYNAMSADGQPPKKKHKTM